MLLISKCLHSPGWALVSDPGGLLWGSAYNTKIRLRERRERIEGYYLDVELSLIVE